VATKYNQYVMWTMLILYLYILVDGHTQVKIQAVWHASSVNGRVVASSFALSASSNPSVFLLGQLDPEDRHCDRSKSRKILAQRQTVTSKKTRI
jgi:hypothetical protein